MPEEGCKLASIPAGLFPLIQQARFDITAVLDGKVRAGLFPVDTADIIRHLTVSAGESPGGTSEQGTAGLAAAVPESGRERS